ncbi:MULTISPECIES: type II secretion system secretin GspD [unclassified Brevundimonas]|uniref:type II secretion system secretin GspD n=1 Tax=unclassified Brevundimonas TaxID=2622653 RepID=UPI000CFBACE0|nr:MULTISPECIES: type II secretion system secretin GspD [unclassified Brevundimonas]PRA28169.1 type II secretion system protein GspD [Brevundimonas sp. MYb27]PQZ79641.1 type II secretion system protein GspD [Brevundimonas sp. MYb31]PRB15377.1 type II secretion system protein GspD [Brevundimonas sp. MYb52]PRB35700.1 type II secretion system protein GspD [Brevundimonas sp. MYb46]PRB46335.1 type II secretion system protein GspD [Brevundimonas sp. MYb33]
MRLHRSFAAVALSALIAVQGPLLASPAFAQEGARQTLNVQGADIRAFIQDVARTTGRTFIVDPAVTGNVTVTSQRALNRSELFEVFLSTLRANGLVVTPTSSGAYRISPAQGAAQGPSTVGSERFSTQVFQLRNIDAASAAETIRPLVGAQGQVLANPSGNSVVVADFADNLSRIRSLIQRIDVDRASFDVVTLENSSAAEIAGVLAQVLAPPGGQPGQGMVSVTPVASSNSVILRGDPAAVARVRPLVEDLDRRARSADDVKVVFLQHANAEQLLPVLQQIVGQPVTAASATATPAAARGTGEAAVAQPVAAPAAPAPGQKASIARFPGANALVISASADTQRMLAEVIRQLDSRRQQVLIEAIVVELGDTAVRELGVQWLLAGSDGNPIGLTNYSDRAAPLVPIAGGAAAGQLDKDDPLRKQLQDLALNSLVGANGFIGGGGGRIGSDGLFGFIINAAKSDEGSNLLQTPSLMTLDNEEATILVGQEVPITTGEALLDGNSNPFRTTQRQDIGVKLIVKPQINAGGSITLFLRQEVSSINGVLTRGASDLVLNKRELETTLVVDDGEIAVAGGLLDQNDRLSVDKVPGLGDVPVLGALFKSTSRQRGRTNLMVFIRPTIIRTPGDAQQLSADRWGYMRGEQLRSQPGVEPSLDEMLRDYMRTQAPVAPRAIDNPAPGATAPVGEVTISPLAPAANAVSPQG